MLRGASVTGGQHFLRTRFCNSIVNPSAIFLVAEQSQQVVGFIVGFILPTKRTEATIHSTMVHRQRVRQGIGSLLVRSFADFAFEKGVEVIEAEVEKGPDKFYEKCGFKKTGIWYSIVLKKRLTCPKDEAST